MIDFDSLSYKDHSLGIDILYGDDKIGYFFWDTTIGVNGETLHKVTHMEIDPSYRHQGVAKTILKRFIEDTGDIISFGEESDTESDDGSHLVGDGPEFVKSWRRDH